MVDLPPDSFPSVAFRAARNLQRSLGRCRTSRAAEARWEDASL